MPATKGRLVPYLRAWREYRSLEQQELAKKAGVTATTISRLENGAPGRIGTIGKLATALEISREQLLREKPKDRAA